MNIINKKYIPHVVIAVLSFIIVHSIVKIAKNEL